MLDKLKTIRTLVIAAVFCGCSFAVFADPTNSTPVTNPDNTASTDQTQSSTDQTQAADQTQNINAAAFQKLLSDYFPLTPTQVHEFTNASAEQQQAAAQPPGPTPPEGTSAIVPVTLKPGGVMPIVRIGAGMITSLVFIDASGQVWPVSSYSVGDPTSFSVQWDKKSGVLMVQGQKLYAQTNIAVMLQGLDIPVSINLLVGQKKWDYLDYIQVDQNQPGDNNSPTPVAQAPGFLTDLLNGIPPQGATQATVSDSNVAQVWSYQGQFIMLTKATLLSPAYVSKADGPGTQPLHAYALPQAPEVLISNMGNIEKLIITTGASNASST